MDPVPKALGGKPWASRGQALCGQAELRPCEPFPILLSHSHVVHYVISLSGSLLASGIFSEGTPLPAAGLRGRGGGNRAAANAAASRTPLVTSAAPVTSHIPPSSSPPPIRPSPPPLPLCKPFTVPSTPGWRLWWRSVARRGGAGRGAARHCEPRASASPQPLRRPARACRACRASAAASAGWQERAKGARVVGPGGESVYTVYTPAGSAQAERVLRK